MEQVSQSALQDIQHNCDKKIYRKHKRQQMITVEDVIYASFIEALSIISLDEHMDTWMNI